MRRMGRLAQNSGNLRTIRASLFRPRADFDMLSQRKLSDMLSPRTASGAGSNPQRAIALWHDQTWQPVPGQLQQRFLATGCCAASGFHGRFKLVQSVDRCPPVSKPSGPTDGTRRSDIKWRRWHVQPEFDRRQINHRLAMRSDRATMHTAD